MKKYFKYVLLLTLSLIIIESANAQEKSEKSSNHDLYVEGISSTIYISAGTQILNLKNLNTELNSLNYSSFSNINYTMGIGCEVGIYDRGVVSGEFDFQRNTSSSFCTTTKSKGSFHGTKTYIRFGYNVIHLKKFNLTPEIGLGGNILKLNINDNYATNVDSISNISFGNALSSREENILQYTNSFVSIGIGFDFTIRNEMIENSKNALRIGFRTGYQHGITNVWQNSNSTVIGPNINKNMIYAKITIGIISY